MGGMTILRLASTDPGMFGDRVQQSMAIDGGVIYSIEGRRTTATPQRENEQRHPWGNIPRRSRSNWLICRSARA